LTPTGLRKDGYVLLLSPGVLALEVRDPDFRMYAWGLSGGRLFTGAKRFATIFGGFFEHNLWVNRLDPERGDRAAALNFIRLGPELRLGGSSERVFGYGLARLGIDIVAARGAPGAGLVHGYWRRRHHGRIDAKSASLTRLRAGDRLQRSV
jgi:hypothetical protein